MSELIVFIIIAIVGTLINVSAKRQRARSAEQPMAGPDNARERRLNASRTSPEKPPEMRVPPLKGSFAELTAQFDQRREQAAQEHSEGMARAGSLQFDSTEGQDTPGHDHGFTESAPAQPVRPLRSEDEGASTGVRARRACIPNLRQAIVLTEILGKPVSQRRRT